MSHSLLPSRVGPPVQNPHAKPGHAAVNRALPTTQRETSDCDNCSKEMAVAALDGAVRGSIWKEVF